MFLPLNRHYAYPDYLHIPIWLPFAWGFVSVLIIRIAQNFLKTVE